MAHDERIPPVEPGQPAVPENGSLPDSCQPGGASAPATDLQTSTPELKFGRLTSKQALKLAREAGLTDEGVKRLIECRRAPSRNVRSSWGNVSGEFWSEKCGHAIQFESYLGEWVVAQVLLADGKVMWLGSQTPPLPVSFIGANGRRQRSICTNDYMYLLDDGSVHEIECKLEPEIKKLLAEKPHLYARDEHGVVYRPAVREALQQMGIRHRVVVPEETSLLLARNAKYLGPYRHPRLSEEIAGQVREALRDGPLQAVVLSTRTTGNIDDVLRAIAQDVVHVDLRHFAAWETETVVVHGSRESMSAFIHLADRAPTKCDVVPPLHIGQSGTWDGKPFTVAHVGESAVFLKSGDETDVQSVDLPNTEFERLRRKGAIQLESKEVLIHGVDREVARYAQLTDQERAVARDRTEQVRGVLSGRWEVNEAATHLGISRRQIYRFIRLYKGNDPEAPDGGFSALAPKTRNCGLRGWNVAPEVLERLDEAINGIYFRKKKKTLPRPTRASAYKAYRSRCNEAGAVPVSRKTFYKRVDALTNQQSAAARDGIRVANQKRVSRGQDPDQAVHPFHQLQIDATLGDQLLELFAEEVGDCWFQRPTITPVYDCYSTACVGFSCLFGAESSVSATMAFRDVVRREGRFPDVLFADGAGAYRADVMRDLMIGAGKGEVRFRPAGRPEFGGQVERLIKSMTDELLLGLAGSTERLKAVRTLTKSHDPLRDVVWSMEALTSFLEFFFFRHYNQRVHPSIGTTPEQRLRDGFALRGSRDAQRVQYNEHFEIATMPTVKDGRILDREKGVFLHSTRYRNVELCSKLPANTQFGRRPVRFDPWNLARIFVFVGGQWEEFRSRQADILSRYTVGEAQALARAYPTQMAEARRARRDDDDAMARFMLWVDAEQEGRKARARTEANRQANPSASTASPHGDRSPRAGREGTRSGDRWSRFQLPNRDGRSGGTERA